MLDVLIIGAGITGVTIGRLLQMRGIDNFIILEAAAEPGGLCRTELIAGHVLDTGGGHFLCSKYPEVYDFVFSHIPVSAFSLFERVSKVSLQGNIIDYPIEANIWQLPVEAQIDYLQSVMQTNDQKHIPITNYEEWIRGNLGEKIAVNYMLPYNQKLWGIEPCHMDIDWLGKIPQLNLREILAACLSKKPDRNKMPSHTRFYYPKQGGFQEIFDGIYSRVKQAVALNEQVKSLRFLGDFWSVNDTFEARIVINTAPWPDLYEGLGAPPELEGCFTKLKSNSIVVSLWEESYEHDWHWCYYPDSQFHYHRDFFINNFAPHSRTGGVYTETNLLRWPGS